MALGGVLNRPTSKKRRKGMVDMKKNKGFSILRLLIVIICIFSVIISVGVNVLFTKSKIPHISDRYIYIVEEPNPLEGVVSTNAALIAKEAKNISVAAGDVVICYPADDPSKLTIRSINAVVESEYGTERYYTRDSVHEDNTDSITKDRIVAVCTGYPESIELGKFLLFTLDIKGIIAELIVPCAILLIMLIVKIASSRGSEDDEDDEDEDDEGYGFYSYDENESKKSSKKKPQKNRNPLYEPEMKPAVNDELERKKMSIAENFSQKEVNHDSPYQKEKERTMQFKAQKAETEKLATKKINAKPAYPSHEADSSENLSKQSAKPLELERFEAPAPSQTANVQKPAAHEKAPVQNTADASDIKGLDDQKALNVRTQAPASMPIASSAPETPKPAEKPVSDSSPDISDIIRKTEKIRNKKKVDAMSVDDLIRMIDEEKNKL